MFSKYKRKKMHSSMKDHPFYKNINKSMRTNSSSKYKKLANFLRYRHNNKQSANYILN